MDFDNFRQSFEFQRQLVQQQKAEQVEAGKCDHEYKKFKQTIPADNFKYNKGQAYFTVLACTKCQTKHLMDYKMEA